MSERQLAPVTAPVPPQNLDAEESVLGAMLMSPGAITAVVDVVAPSDFYRESHARIYRAALTVHAAGDPVDAITVVDQLEIQGDLEDAGGRQRVHELAALVPATANAAHYAGIVHEMAQLRRLIVVGGEIARLGWERPGETDALLEQARALAAGVDTAGDGELTLESWATFERSAATEHIPTIVDGLWAEGGFGFVAAPPKKGKTWIGLSLAIAVAAGKPFLQRFPVSKARPVVYLALEGHRAAIRGRIGALARGLDLNPDQPSHDLDNLHLLYKPRGINLNDPAWVRRIRTTIEHVNAELVIVDVLRAAAVLKENSNDEFSQLRAVLQPITDDGVAIALLHHFGKLTEISRERTPGERMSGAGAMYGALDVGVFITAADDGARTLRVEFETRDLAQPHELGIHLEGEGTGESGGFVYRDTATWAEREPQAAEDVVAPPADVLAWLSAQPDRTATATEIAYAFDCSDKTVFRRRGEYERYGITYEPSRGNRASRFFIVDNIDGDQAALFSATSTNVPLSRDTHDVPQEPDNKAKTPGETPSGTLPDIANVPQTATAENMPISRENSERDSGTLSDISYGDGHAEAHVPLRDAELEPTENDPERADEWDA